jgi:hypothetical protein
MSSDENLPQNPTPEENPSPTSPQEPTEQGTENTAHFEPSEALPEAPESSPSDFSVKSNDIPPSDSTPPEPQKTQENQAENEPVTEPSADAEAKADEETAQILVNEPLPESEPSVSEAKEEPKPIETLEPEPEKEKTRTSYLKSQKWGELLITARDAIQFRKRKKLDRVMSLFLEKSKITNDEIEKLLHVSDATATRYLSQLKKEGRIKQNGKTGKEVSYSRI